MGKIIKLQDILPLDELRKKGKVLLIRHHHEKLAEMNEMNLIEEYQSFQSKKAFFDCKYIVSFLGGEKNSAVFYGLYEVKDRLAKEHLPNYSKEIEKYCNKQNPSKDIYLKLERIEKYDIFTDRLVINWFVPRGWYNTYGEVQDKEVMKILPNNFVDDFPGLMNIMVSYKKLKKIIENPQSHSVWFESLTRLQAIYLILDKKSGNKYVGTTYGENGLWQRWESYIKGDGTGNNKELKVLKGKDPEFYLNFQFSILEVLSKTANQKYCTEKESIWKEKLGSKAFGLNRN